MKKLVIISGKGGTGKSSVMASLALLLSKEKKIVGVDCDVDAPNLGLCLSVKDKDFKFEEVETSYKARIDKKKCIGCGKCKEVCRFSAISIDEKGKPDIDRFSCEGCGACSLVCPVKAIKLEKVKDGKIGVAETKYGFNLVSGQLKMGESGSGKIVYLTKEKARELAEKEGASFILIDSAAGTGCPVIASVQGSDFVIAVTEPTQTAFHDLKKSLLVVEHFKIPYGLIINKFDVNKNVSEKIEIFAREKNIPLLGKIPYDVKFVEALVNLTPLVLYAKEYENLFNKIKENILSLL